MPDIDTLPNIAEVKDLEAVPALLAPYVASHGPLFVFCEDVTGHLFVSHSAAAQRGAEMLYKIGPQGSLGVRRTGAKAYSLGICVDSLPSGTAGKRGGNIVA